MEGDNEDNRIDHEGEEEEGDHLAWTSSSARFGLLAGFRHHRQHLQVRACAEWRRTRALCHDNSSVAMNSDGDSPVATNTSQDLPLPPNS